MADEEVFSCFGVCWEAKSEPPFPIVIFIVLEVALVCTSHFLAIIFNSSFIYNGKLVSALLIFKDNVIWNGIHP